jgi:sugar lactone lactonase YvrE
VLQDGRIVVCDTHYHRAIVFSRDGQILDQFGTRGEGPGQFIYPVAVCADPDDSLYVCEYGGNDRVQKFTADGEWLATFGDFGTGPQDFQRPSGIAWLDGRLYIADAINNRVLVFTDDGRFVERLGGEGGLELRLPYGVAAGPDAVLYIVEYGAGRVTAVTPDGRVVGRYGTVGTGDGHLRTPWGLAVDSRRRVSVADTGNRRIVELSL